ncbi:fibronectin type III domain-containing protein 7-like [Xenopus laevis]|uniref:Fibronectin type III domain-containing protein 7-like n=1 Tax=Xenopus laevis TaxID=8355 RepID=A0A8J0V355_XENLA|nr:fibronectin type III domain-containing protein 7-like [Xenopus laevis]
MQYKCNDDKAELSWKAALGALGYTATVSTQGIEIVNCSTRETSCIIDGIKCGQIYTMTVETFGVNCNNNVTSTVTFPTAPCVPEQQPPQFSCDTNTASLSWGRTLGAARYISNVTAPNVETLTCETNDMTCNITDFHCGQVYTATVSGINNQCRSLESLPTTVITVPCQPQNVTAKIDCTSFAASVSWDIAPGALRYSATLKASGGEKLKCNSTELGCQVKNLQCGQIYAVTVTAFNELCQSVSSSPIELESVPCVPTQGLADISCESNAVNVSWAPTPGAVNYTATISGPQGQQFICHSLNRACTFPWLSCGAEYNATIVAVGNTCSSVSSQHISFQTVPCQPKNVSAQMICSSSVASVTWHETPGALRYLSTLTSSRAVELTCNSTKLGCEVSSLQCGEAYTVTVSAFNYECQGIPSLPTELLSVPCVPSHIQSKVSCETNTTIMSWAAAEGAVNYIGLVTGPHGEEYECQEVGTSCNITQLSCGLEYNATVLAVGHSCSSKSSEAIAVYTGPCVPQNFTAITDCEDSSAVLTWSKTPGALNYTALARGPDGKDFTCDTESTTCRIPALHCGSTYNVSVRAFNEQCVGESSTVVQLITAPCAPDGLQAEVGCVANSISLSWEQMDNAHSFQCYLTGHDGLTQTCNSTEKKCVFLNLPCGQIYSATVSASTSQCTGPTSKAISIETGR